MLIVYGMPRERWTVDEIFNLFSTCGNVVRVRSLQYKPGTSVRGSICCIVPVCRNALSLADILVVRRVAYFVEESSSSSWSSWSWSSWSSWWWWWWWSSSSSLTPQLSVSVSMVAVVVTRCRR